MTRQNNDTGHEMWIWSSEQGSDIEGERYLSAAQRQAVVDSAAEQGIEVIAVYLAQARMADVPDDAVELSKQVERSNKQ